MLQGGVHVFSVAGIPVYLSPIFLVLIGITVFQGGVVFGGLWAAAITVSILFHELGHATVARHYRLSPTITLHGWGGLCHHDAPAQERDDALIIIAGPAAGLLLGGVVYALQSVLPAETFLQAPLLARFFGMMLYVNIFWSLINLLPFWPLDGGQLFRLGMVKWFGGATGEKITHVVGATLGILLVVLAYGSYGGGFVVFLAGYITIMNFQRINDPSTSGAIYSQNRFAKELQKKMTAAYDAGDTEEAYRLGQQIRAETNVDAKTLGRTWEVLGVVAALRDDYVEAWSYLKRAPERGRVVEAKAACIIALELVDEAKAFVAAGKHRKVPERLQSELERLAER